MSSTGEAFEGEHPPRELRSSPPLVGQSFSHCLSKFCSCAWAVVPFSLSIFMAPVSSSDAEQSPCVLLGDGDLLAL